MPEYTLNCENLPCPQPVMRIKKLLDQSSPQEIVVIVDNDPARENVTRFLASRGYGSSHTREGALWRIVGKREDALSPASHAAESGGEKPSFTVSAPHPQAEEAKTLIMLLAPVFGSGDDTLGKKLMKNFLSTLPEMGSSLWRVVLLNGGVTLAAENSHVLAELQALESAGVSILVCGTCLEHFSLLDKKSVGQTTNMLDVVTSMHLADKIIRV